MKKHYLLPVLLTCIPFVLQAQWSMVRFDEYNFFTKTAVPDPATSIIAGMDPMGTGSFILRTNNGGASWDSIPLSNSTTNYHIISMFFTDINNGIAGGTKNNLQTLLKTSDNASTWNDITPDPASVDPVTSVNFTDPSNGYASDETQLYKTNDGGISWSQSTPGFTVKDIGFTDMNNGYACGQNASLAVVMKTNDGGQNWNTVLSTNLPFSSVSSMQKLDVVNPDAVYCSGQYSNVLYRTDNAGLTWDTITLPQIYGIQDYDFINAYDGHLLSTMGEIFGTNNGGQTWTLEYAVASGAYGPSVFLNSIAFAGTTGYVCGSSGLVKKYMEPTGISETQELNLSMYPNPVIQGQVLHLNGVISDYTLKIFTLEGKCVLDRVYPPDQPVVLSLDAGNYLIEVTNGSELLHEKLVIIH